MKKTVLLIISILCIAGGCILFDVSTFVATAVMLLIVGLFCFVMWFVAAIIELFEGG